MVPPAISLSLYIQQYGCPLPVLSVCPYRCIIVFARSLRLYHCLYTCSSMLTRFLWLYVCPYACCRLQTECSFGLCDYIFLLAAIYPDACSNISFSMQQFCFTCRSLFAHSLWLYLCLVPAVVFPPAAVFLAILAEIVFLI